MFNAFINSPLRASIARLAISVLLCVAGAGKIINVLLAGIEDADSLYTLSLACSELVLAFGLLSPYLRTQTLCRLFSAWLSLLFLAVAGLRATSGKTQQARIEELQAKLAKAQKTSRNSSKPPSSDITKPPSSAPATTPDGKRKQGGQPGHEKHSSTEFTPDQIDPVQRIPLGDCPCCGGNVAELDAPPETFHQVEVAAKPAVVAEYQRGSGWCEHCQTSVKPDWPPGPCRSRSDGTWPDRIGRLPQGPLQHVDRHDQALLARLVCRFISAKAISQNCSIESLRVHGVEQVNFGVNGSGR